MNQLDIENSNECIDSALGVDEPSVVYERKDNAILRLTIEFSLKIIVYCELLESEKKFVIAKQLLASGTSIGANSREAQNAESAKDFIHRFKIALREAEESVYWLELCTRSPSYPNPPEDLLVYLDRIIKVLNKIIATTKRQLNRDK